MDGIAEVSLLSTGFRAIAMLFIVLGFLILVLYLMKRFLLLRRGAKGNLFIKVLTSMHLSPKERIEVIEVLGERIVLGITPGNISFLTKLSDLRAEHKDLQGGNKDNEIKG
jgi:flagellar protein FliO/FliZ